MNQFKALAELEILGKVSKKIVNQEAQTIRFEYSLANSFMVKGTSLTISLIMFMGSLLPLFGPPTEGLWKVSLVMLALAFPPFILFIAAQKTCHYCLLDFKNMKIRTGIKKLSKERNILSDDLNNIKFIVLDSERAKGRSSYVAFKHHAAFINKDGVRFYFTRLFNEGYYKKVFEFLKESSEIFKFSTFQNDFIKNAILQYLTMFPKYSYLILSIEVRFTNIIKPLLYEMNLEHINLLLEALNKHTELRNRMEIRNSILKIVEEKFKNKIEREKYPEVF